MTEKEIQLTLDVGILKAIKAHIGYIPDDETRLQHGLITMDYPEEGHVRMTYSWDCETILTATMADGKIYMNNKEEKDGKGERMDAAGTQSA